jgi:hypothetical protein
LQALDASSIDAAIDGYTMVACDLNDPTECKELFTILHKWRRHPLGEVFAELFELVCMEGKDGKQGRLEQDL